MISNDTSSHKMHLPRFEVEDVTEITNTGVLVLARLLDNTDFSIKQGLKLGGCEITGGNIPRSVTNSGAARYDLWGFYLARKADSKYFKKGMVVELTQD